MLSPFARATGWAVALIASIALVPGLLLPAIATAADPDPDPVVACDGTSFTTSTVDGREVVRCDDGKVRDWQRVAIADAAITRPTSGSATLSFAVTRREAGNPVFLTVRTANGTAMAPADYTALDTTFVLEADETSATVEVPVARQTIRQDDKTLTATLADAQGDVVAFARARAVGTLRNALNLSSQPDAEYLCDGGFYSLNDLPAPWTGRGVRCLGRDPQPHAVMTAADVAADPQAGSVTFQFSRPAGHAAIVLAYETVDGSARAGVDYVATSGLALAAADSYVHRITVPLLPGAAAGGDRGFSLRVTSGWAWTPVPEQRPVATIRGLPAPGGTARVGHRLTGAAADATALQWERCDAQGACADVPGATDAGYTPALADVGSRLRLRATVPVSDGGTATLRTPLTSAVDVAPADPAAACDGTAFTTSTVDGREAVRCDDGLIRDWQRVAIRDASVVRPSTGGAELRFRVVRPEAGTPLFLDWGTGGGSAIAGTDYLPASGRLVLEADQTSAEVVVPVVGRERRFADANVGVALSDAQGDVVDFARARAHGWIVATLTGQAPPFDAFSSCHGGGFQIAIHRDNRLIRCVLAPGQAPFDWMRFTAVSRVVDPRAGLAAVPITRPSGSELAFLSWTTADGSATAGSDYEASTGEVAVMGSGRTAIVPLVPDGAGGSFAVSLGDPVGAMSYELNGGTIAIAARPQTTGLPRLGRQLTVATAADGWRWERCDTALACAPIAGANAAAYTPVAADVGARLRVRTTTTASDGLTVLADSALTAPVRAALATPTLTGGPADGTFTESRTALFSVGALEGDATPECSLDGAGFAACGDVELTGLASGPHRLVVRQRSVDGIVSGTAVRDWTVVVAPDPAAVCDGTAFTTDTVDGRAVVACDDGGTRDWQRVAVRDAAVTRNVGGGGTLRFAVERRAAGNPLWVRYGTADGTATAGGGYTATSGVLLLEADQTSGTVSVPVPAATGSGDDLTLRLDIGDERGAGIEFLRGAATGTIRNDAVSRRIDAELACSGSLFDIVIIHRLPNPRCLWSGGPDEPRSDPWFSDFVVGDPVVDPRAGVATFVVRRPVGGGRAWLSWETSDGSARAGVDYVASRGTLMWSGDQLVQRVSVPLLDPPGADADRSFTLRVANAEPAMSFDPAEGTATIRRFTPAIAGTPRVGTALTGAPDAALRQWQRCDDDGACWTIPSANGATYTPVAADVGSRLRVRAYLTGTDGPALAAETPTTAQVAVAPADGVAACDGTPFTTATVDGREVVACEDGGTRDWQRVTIADARVRRSTGGATTLAFEVTRPESGAPLFLRYRTANGTAVAGADYTARDGVLVLEADQTSGAIEVPVATQTAVATDDRTLSVALADERGAGVELARDRATGTLVNGLLSRQIDGDEACDGGAYDVVVVDGYRVSRCLSGSAWGWSQITASSPVVDPAAGVATFRLERANAANPIWVDWTTADGTARAGVDYAAASGQQLMTFGQRVATVTVPIAPDGAGGDRSFALRLANGQPSLPFTGTDGTATIRRIAPAPTGTAKVGETLTHPDAGAATRQWQRCDAQGACWAIPDATGATLALGERLLGSRLRVRATAPGDDGATIAALSPLADAVAAADPRVPADPRDPVDPRDPTDPGTPVDPPAGGERRAPTGARVTGRRQQNRGVVRAVAGTTNVILRCSAACRLRAPLTVSEAARRRLGLRSTRIGVADGRTRAAGLVRLQVRLARHERARLLAIGRPVTVVVRLTTPRGETVTVRFRLLPAKARAGR